MPDEDSPRGFSNSEQRLARDFAQALPASARAEFLDRLAHAVSRQPRDMPIAIFSHHGKAHLGRNAKGGC